MLDVMIDIETLSTHADARLVSIGAVAYTIGVWSTTFYVRVRDVEGHVSPNSVAWWLTQKPAAREEISLCLQGGRTLPEALGSLHNWFLSLAVKDPEHTIWAKPAMFDIPILEAAHHRAGMHVPWNFRQVRCLREYKASRPELAYPKRSKKSVAHNALDDALYQMECHQAWRAASEASP